MKLNLIEGGRNVQERDITAFYGVNRTAKINDFELSDAKNFDSEAFPHIMTRKSRELFYSENKMQMICKDTDIYDDYKVTGVTEDGGFVYRGERLLDSGLSGNTQITEFSGDYVLLPGEKVVTVSQNAVESEIDYSARVLGFSEFEGDFEGFHFQSDFSMSNVPLTYGLDITNGKMSYMYYGNSDNFYKTGLAYMNFFFNVAHPGMAFRLKLYSRKGTASGFEEIAQHELPDDVYMVIDRMQCNIDGVYYSFGDEKFSYDFARNYFSTDGGVGTYIYYTARKVMTGEVYDISQDFEYYRDGVLVKDGSFTTGVYGGVFSGGSARGVLWRDVDILQCHNPMLLGAPYGGRFFGCDNLGVTVYYSSASDKYDFVISESAGGAGYVLCSDPGKWTAICPYNEVLYVFKRNGMYRIYSSDGLSFYMERIADVGAVSNDAVCVVDNVMYFLSENGLCRFLGSYPEYLPDSLGKKYSDGVLGGSDGKIFASLTYKDGDVEKSELCVWHTDKQIFSVHDDFPAEKFVSAAGELFALSDGSVYKMECGREPLEFSLDTKNYFFSFTKKGVNGARLYFDFSGNEGESFEVFVSYDGGEFEPCFKPITNGKVKYVPIRLRKCDEVRLRISGKGVFTLKGLSFSLYQNGDVRQNR